MRLRERARRKKNEEENARHEFNDRRRMLSLVKCIEEELWEGLEVERRKSLKMKDLRKFWGWFKVILGEIRSFSNKNSNFIASSLKLNFPLIS